MAKNNKSKLIIGAGILVVTGTIAYFIVRGVRRKNISERIYKKLDDVTTQEGLGATLTEDEKHKANFGFDSNFWKEGKNGILPNNNLLLPPRIARDRARAINDAIGYFSEDENAIMNEIKKLRSQGQLSQVTHAYGTTPLNFGNLADDIQSALSGSFFTNDRLKEMNNYINSLPY